jgi:hypothetical protein
LSIAVESILTRRRWLDQFCVTNQHKYIRIRSRNQFGIKDPKTSQAKAPHLYYSMDELPVANAQIYIEYLTGIMQCQKSIR